MKLGAVFGAVAAAGVLACAGQAAASTWVATYKGHIDGGYDATGVFGAADTDLSELSFVATFTYDTEALLSSVTSGPTKEVGIDTVLSATLSIDGSAAYELGSGFGNHIESHSVSPFGSFGPGYVFHQIVAVFSVPGFFSVNNELTLGGAGATPAFLAQAVAETALVDPNFGGSTAYSGYFQIEESGFLGSASAYGYLRPEFYSVAAVDTGTALPEPGAWALMILGFGAAGSALRRKRALA